MIFGKNLVIFSERFTHLITKRSFGSSNDKITYQLLTPEDKPKIKKILLSDQYEGTPLREYLKISKLEEVITADCDVIDSHCSIKAVAPSGEIVGFITNKIVNRFVSI